MDGPLYPPSEGSHPYGVFCLRMDFLVGVPLFFGPAIRFFFVDGLFARMREEARGFVIAPEAVIDESVSGSIGHELAEHCLHTAVGVARQDMRTIDSDYPVVLGAIKTEDELGTFDS